MRSPVTPRTVRTALCAALAAPAALAGCGDINNTDLQFLAVLPDGSLALQPPQEQGQALTGSLQQALGAAPDPLVHARNVAQKVNAFVQGVVDGLDKVTTKLPPKERGADRRVWGPYQKAGHWWRLVMTRAGTAYDWGVDLAEAAAGPWDRVIAGTVDGADFTESSGTLRFDLDLLTQRHRGALAVDSTAHGVTVDWTRAGADWTIRVKVDSSDESVGALAGNYEFTYRRTPDGAGDFAFVLYADALGDAVPREFAARVRWNPAQAGRADYRIRGGSLAAPVLGTTCWTTPGAPTWSWDDARRWREQGSEAACAFPDRATLPW